MLFTAIFSFVATVYKFPPTTTLVDLFLDTHNGYPGKSAIALTWIALNTPTVFLICLILLLDKRTGSVSTEVRGSGRTGIVIKRKNQLQSAFIGIPIYVNGEFAGKSYRKKDLFLNVKSATCSVTAGEGSESSTINVYVPLLEKITLQLEIVPMGPLGLKCVLKREEKSNSHLEHKNAS